MLKLSNAIGAPFRSYVSEQLRLRAEKSSTDVRSIQDVLYLANKNAWVRLQSSVEVSPGYIEELKYYYNNREPNQPLTANSGKELAQNWVLQSGTSKVSDDNDITLRYGLGVDGAYGLGGITNQGYRPMPGLDSVTIETAGRMGSLRYATVNFKVWNMNQLDIIDALYFRLGFTMLLEWGHVEYYDNKGNYQTDISSIANFFAADANKEKIQKAINDRVELSCGNYDGMFGTVTNFNYSMNQEGGWDCSIKLVGLGNLLETQKINSSYTMPDGLSKQFLALQTGLTAMINAGIDRDNANAKATAAATAKQAVDDAYQAQLDAYNKAHPITDLATFYKAAQNEDWDITNLDKVTNLIQRTVVAPIGNGILTKPNSQFQFLYITNNESKNTGYIYGTKVYPAWIRSGVGDNTSGFRYPLTEQNQYGINMPALNAYMRQANNYNDAINNILSPNSNFRSNIGAFLYANATSQLPIRIGNTVNLDIQQYIGNELSDPLLITQDLGIRIGSKYATYLTPDTSYSSNGYWSIKAKITGISGASWDDLKRRGMVKSSIDAILHKIDEALANEGDGSVWTLENYNTAKIDSDVFKSSNLDGPNNVPTNYLTVKISKPVQIDGIQIYDSSGQSTTTSLTFTVQVETGIFPLLTSLVKLASDQAPPTKGTVGDVNYEKKAHVPVTSTDSGFNSLSSALEAMLTFVQYDAIFHEDKKNNPHVDVKKIDKITAQILGGISAAPMASLFTAKGLDPNYPKPAVPSKPEYYTDPYYLGLKGYNTALMSGQTNNGGSFGAIDAYTTTPSASFEDLMYSYKLPKKYEDTTAAGGFGSLIQPVYIKLGYLLFFINNLCLLFDSTKPGPNPASGTAAARPYFYIDFNPETNFCLTTPYQMSVNPEVCIIPWKGTQDDYDYIFKSNGATPVKNKNNQSVIGNYRLFDFSQYDVVSDGITKHGSFISTGNGSAYRGKTMNILVNTQHLINLLHELVNRDGHSDVYLKPYMDRLLEDLNKAMGDINAFRLGYIDSSNTVAILDDQFVPPSEDEESAMKSRMELLSPSGRFIVPIFGQRSIARSVEFQTNITTKMSSLLAIGARSTNASSGSTQSTDGSALNWLSTGLSDRVMTEAEDISKVASNPPTATATAAKNNQKLAEKFDEYIASIYGANNYKSKTNSSIDRAGITPSVNYYIQATTRRKAADPATSGAPVIPLNLSFSTDGISGVNMGNVFLVPEDKLPISLRANINKSPRFGYMVMGLNHQIQSNQWITDIKGQIIKLRTDESYGVAGTVTSAAAASTAAGTTAGGNTNASNCDLFLYLAWQQGPDGAAQHYSLSTGNGKYTRYSIPAKNIVDNWPGGYVSSAGIGANDVRRLYSDPANHAQLAEAFVDVQRQIYANKQTEGLQLINGSGNNRSGVPYSTIKQALQQYADPTNGLTYEGFVTFAYIENGLQTDTIDTSNYKTMFQMNSTISTLSTVINSLTKAQGYVVGYTDYGPVDSLASQVAPIIVSNFNSFKTAANFTEQC